MQVEAAPVPSAQRAPFSTSPQLPEASPPGGSNLTAYSFPPPPRTAAGDEHLQRSRGNNTASPAPSAGEFGSSRHDEGHFSFTALPHAQQQHPDHRHGYDDEHRPDGFTQPRSMSLAGVVDFGGEPLARTSSPAMAHGVPAHAQSPHHQLSQLQHHEYHALGRGSGGGGGQAQRILSSFQFNEYLPEHAHLAPPAHLVQQHLHHHHAGVSSQFAPPPPGPAHPFVQYRPYTFGTATTPSHPLARASYVAGPPGPPLEWAKPRATGDEAPNAQHARAFAPPPGSSRAHQQQQQQAAHMMYYSPHHPDGLMLRTTSNQSGLSSFSESTDLSQHPSNGGNASDYEGHHVNPAFVHGGADSGYYSSPQMDRSSELARSTSSSDLRGVSGLRLDGPSSSAMSRPNKADSDRTIRGLRLNDMNQSTLRAVTGRAHADDSRASTPSSSGKAARRRVASTIFHPPPQAMLAPGAYSPSGSAIGARRGKPYATTQHTAILPTDDEFAALPTKRSRGRRPPVTTDLGADEVDPNGEPTQAQIAWAGTTKTGKVKKIFLCKVPGCGKCFKRSEHLKRHVRSIHTNEKPFQCQWPTCKRLFSRHDNLNQHLRIHREPGMTDAEFSAALQDCFGQRLEEVQRERSWAAPAGASGLAPAPTPAPGLGHATAADRACERSFDAVEGDAHDDNAHVDADDDRDGEGEGGDEYQASESDEDDDERAFAASARAGRAGTGTGTGTGGRSRRTTRARTAAASASAASAGAGDDDDDDYEPPEGVGRSASRGAGRRARND